ncbi:MAG: mreC [Nevskia sp.]|nr:mreC [Nevskia sp.]
MNTTLHDSAPKPLFSRGPGLALNFFLLACLSITLMVMDSTGTRFAPARAWVAWALQPLMWVAQAPQAVAQLGDNFHTRDQLLAENRQLKQRQTELDGRLLKLESLEAENERIRALLSSAASLPDRVLISEVMATSQDPYRHQIVLNRGEQDGVYKGQALVDANGVMGQVIQVNPTTCVALLITDPDHGIPVEINRTGLQTIALGRGDGQGLSLPYLPGNADIKVGDLLVSSGLGGRFPAGYPVGRIFELRHPAGENFMEALAYPTAKLNQGRQALLVWSEHNTPPVDVSVPTARPEMKQKAQHPQERAADHAAPAAAPTPRAAGATGNASSPAPAGAAAATNKPAAKPAATPNTAAPTAPKPKPAAPAAPPPAPHP